MAPLAHIDLVEAIDNGLQELMEADQYAATLPGVVVVSDSWGVPEFATENQLDTYLSAPGVTFVAATGDNGVPNYPAASPNAIAVGGTWVSGNSEAAWSSSGAGVSQVYPGRKIPDVSMAVNSANFTGTSVSAPLFAGLVGIADALRIQSGLTPLSTADVRSRMNSVVGTTQYRSDFNDITRGHGAHLGPDSTTGLGSPKAPGLVALLSGSSSGVTPSEQSHRNVKVRVSRPHKVFVLLEKRAKPAWVNRAPGEFRQALHHGTVDQGARGSGNSI
jgi:hypothetical protein